MHAAVITKCTTTTKAGRRCSNRSIWGRPHCGKHGGIAVYCLVCGRPSYQSSLCRHHHILWRDHGDPTIEHDPTISGWMAREIKTRDRSAGCWGWDYTADAKGYGQVRHDGRTQRAHRVALILDGQHLDPAKPFGCHHCDNPWCWNPEHLYWGTAKENSGDAVHRDRLSRGERHATVLTQAHVDAIRASGEYQAVLADRYGVSQSMVSRIQNKKRWKQSS